MMKRFVSLLLALLMLTALAVPTALAAAPTIEKVEYEGNGRVEVDFRQDVRYKSPKVSVKDEDGKSYSVKITKKDDDEIKFRVVSPAAGKSYTFTVSGVRAKRSSDYGTVSGSFQVPMAGEVAVKKVEYDHDDREVDFDFTGRVSYKNVKVSIKDAAGRSIRVSKIERDSDDLTVRLSKRLTRGAQYTYAISGVSPRGEGNYQTLKGTFRAYDD